MSLSGIKIWEEQVIIWGEVYPDSASNGTSYGKFRVTFLGDTKVHKFQCVTQGDNENLFISISQSSKRCFLELQSQE